MTTLQEQIAALHKQNTIAFSDIHVVTGQVLHVRVPRGLVTVEGSAPITKAALLEYLSEFAASGKTSAEEWQALIDAGEGQHNARFAASTGAMRAALFNCGGGGGGQQRDWGLALRVMPTKIPDFDTLGLPTQMLQFFERPGGLIVFTGTTGSGKSTSMAAGVDYINGRHNSRIITLEDPIEYQYKNRRSMITQRERPYDFTTFEKGVSQAMREDPDVIVVGEVNDLPSLRAAVSAALTGHLVITSMHTTNAPETISRMIDLYPPEEKEMIRNIIADLLVGVVSQKILPSTDGTKRVLAHEVMTVDSSVRNLLREGKIRNIANDMNKLRPTQHLLNTSLATLVHEGKISEDVALGAAYDRDHLVKSWELTLLEDD